MSKLLNVECSQPKDISVDQILQPPSHAGSREGALGIFEAGQEHAADRSQFRNEDIFISEDKADTFAIDASVSLEDSRESKHLSQHLKEGEIGEANFDKDLTAGYPKEIPPELELVAYGEHTKADFRIPSVEIKSEVELKDHEENVPQKESVTCFSENKNDIHMASLGKYSSEKELLVQDHEEIIAEETFMARSLNSQNDFEMVSEEEASEATSEEDIVIEYHERSHSEEESVGESMQGKADFDMKSAEEAFSVNEIVEDYPEESVGDNDDDFEIADYTKESTSEKKLAMECQKEVVSEVELMVPAPHTKGDFEMASEEVVIECDKDIPVETKSVDESLHTKSDFRPKSENDAKGAIQRVDFEESENVVGALKISEDETDKIHMESPSSTAEEPNSEVRDTNFAVNRSSSEPKYGSADSTPNEPKHMSIYDENNMNIALQEREENLAGFTEHKSTSALPEQGEVCEKQPTKNYEELVQSLPEPDQDEHLVNKNELFESEQISIQPEKDICNGHGENSEIPTQLVPGSDQAENLSFIDDQLEVSGEFESVLEENEASVHTSKPKQDISDDITEKYENLTDSVTLPKVDNLPKDMIEIIETRETVVESVEVSVEPIGEAELDTHKMENLPDLVPTPGNDEGFYVDDHESEDIEETDETIDERADFQSPLEEQIDIKTSNVLESSAPLLLVLDNISEMTVEMNFDKKTSVVSKENDNFVEPEVGESETKIFKDNTISTDEILVDIDKQTSEDILTDEEGITKKEIFDTIERGFDSVCVTETRDVNVENTPPVRYSEGSDQPDVGMPRQLFEEKNRDLDSTDDDQMADSEFVPVTSDQDAKDTEQDLDETLKMPTLDDRLPVESDMFDNQLEQFSENRTIPSDVQGEGNQTIVKAGVECVSLSQDTQSFMEKHIGDRVPHETGATEEKSNQDVEADYSSNNEIKGFNLEEEKIRQNTASADDVESCIIDETIVQDQSEELKIESFEGMTKEESAHTKHMEHLVQLKDKEDVQLDEVDVPNQEDEETGKEKHIDKTCDGNEEHKIEKLREENESSTGAIDLNIDIKLSESSEVCSIDYQKRRHTSPVVVLNDREETGPKVNIGFVRYSLDLETETQVTEYVTSQETLVKFEGIEGEEMKSESLNYAQSVEAEILNGETGLSADKLNEDADHQAETRLDFEKGEECTYRNESYTEEEEFQVVDKQVDSSELHKQVQEPLSKDTSETEQKAALNAVASSILDDVFNQVFEACTDSNIRKEEDEDSQQSDGSYIDLRTMKESMAGDQFEEGESGTSETDDSEEESCLGGHRSEMVQKLEVVIEEAYDISTDVTELASEEYTDSSTEVQTVGKDQTPTAETALTESDSNSESVSDIKVALISSGDSSEDLGRSEEPAPQESEEIDGSHLEIVNVYGVEAAGGSPVKEEAQYTDDIPEGLNRESSSFSSSESGDSSSEMEYIPNEDYTSANKLGQLSEVVEMNEDFSPSDGEVPNVVKLEQENSDNESQTMENHDSEEAPAIESVVRDEEVVNQSKPYQCNDSTSHEEFLAADLNKNEPTDAIDSNDNNQYEVMGCSDEKRSHHTAINNRQLQTAMLGTEVPEDNQPYESSAELFGASLDVEVGSDAESSDEQEDDDVTSEQDLTRFDVIVRKKGNDSFVEQHDQI